MNSGVLYVVATPIGNLGDLSERLKQTLNQVDLIAAEDSRRTLKLLNHLGIRKKIIRCDERAEERASLIVLETLGISQSVALVSDAGTPGISDPGSRLIAKVHEAGYQVVPIPGPSAPSSALSVSGFRGVPFSFFGFFPKRPGERKRLIRRITHSEETVIFFESPYRIKKTLLEFAHALPDRKICVAKEMTKIHETFFRGKILDVAKAFSALPSKGEFTLVISPPSKEEVRRKKWHDSGAE